MINRHLEILFVRHAQSHGNIGESQSDFHPDDPSLTDAGLQQAKALSRRFKTGDLQSIYSSSLIRACQTVQPTAEKLGLEIEVLPDLMEVGTLIPGTTLSHIAALAPNAYSSAKWIFDLYPDYSLENETVDNCVQRADRALHHIVDKSSCGDRILVATHGAFFGFLIRSALGLSLPESFAWEVSNCSVTGIRFRENDIPILFGTNDTGHISLY